MSLVERFSQKLASLGGQALLVPGPAEAGAAVLDILRVRGVAEVVAWDDPLLTQTGLPGALATAGLPGVPGRAERPGIGWLATKPGVEPTALRAAAARAGAGVTGGDWAAAETGTLALLSGRGRPRMVHLLPPLHVAVMPLARLLPTTADLFRELAALPARGQAPGAVQLVTGPSRSADIEDVLVRKMHGPGELVVILVAGVEDGDRRKTDRRGSVRETCG